MTRRGAPHHGSGSVRQTPRASEKFAYFQTVVLPAVYENLPSVFPEFRFSRRGSKWEGDRKMTSEESPLGVRGGRIFVKIDRGGQYPFGFGVAGGGFYPFTAFLAGTGEVMPKGELFWRSAAELAGRAGVDPGPLGDGEPVDRETLRLAREHLERQRRAEHRRQAQKSRESIARARAVWDGAEAAPTSQSGHPAVLRYISARGLSPASLPPRSLGRLRFCARTPVGSTKTKTAPAIIAAVTLSKPDGGETLVAVHRLFLGDDGGKHPDLGKMMLGPTRGGCVKLGTPGELGGGDEAADTLVLCEGIETGLALRAATRLPVWACLSAAGLKSVTLPAAMVGDGTLRKVVVAGDYDDPDFRDKHGRKPPRGHEEMVKAAERIAEQFPDLHVTTAAPGSYWHLVEACEEVAA